MDDDFEFVDDFTWSSAEAPVAPQTVSTLPVPYYSDLPPAPRASSRRDPPASIRGGPLGATTSTPTHNAVPYARYISSVLAKSKSAKKVIGNKRDREDESEVGADTTAEEGPPDMSTPQPVPRMPPPPHNSTAAPLTAEEEPEEGDNEVDDDMLGDAELVAEAWKPTSGTFGRRQRTRARTWTEEENRRFIDCLQQFGTDFSLMAYMFPGRDRLEVKRKFTKWQKTNPDLLSTIMSQRKVTFPLAQFEEWKKKSLEWKK